MTGASKRTAHKLMTTMFASMVSALMLLDLAYLPRAETLGASAQPTLQVAAAADLRDALEEIVPLFERERHVKVRVSFGSSGEFATQIVQGAPFDIFFSANEDFVRMLAAKGLIRQDSVELYAIGRIAIWIRANSPLDLTHGLATLLDERVRFVAIANPEHAPYGQAAVEALRSVGIYLQVQPKFVLGENIGQTLQFVQTGNADAGIVALALVVAPRTNATGRYWLIPAYLHRPIRQTAGVVTGSPVPEVARAFLAFVNGLVGRPIMRRHGFVRPGEAF